jgi:hypothetical protein
MDVLDRAQRLLAKQFDDAPRELLATIDLAMNALQNGSKGEALNELNRAHDLVQRHNLEAWKAEVAAAWAVYHYHNGDMTRMFKAIRYAQRREPDNKRIAALRRVLAE